MVPAVCHTTEMISAWHLDPPVATRTRAGTSLTGSGWMTPSRMSSYLDSASPGNTNIALGAKAVRAFDLFSVTSDWKKKSKYANN